jgi:hypothetical protein
MRQLVQKLLAQVRRALMNFGRTPAGFLAMAAALLFTRQMALRPA